MSIGGVVLQFSADTKAAQKGIDKLTKSIKGVGDDSQTAGKKMSGMAKVGIGAAVAGAALGAAALVDFGKAATKDWQEAERLTRSLKKSTGATKAQTTQVGKWVDSMELATNISDSSLRKGLARLARSTKDLGKAQELSTLAMDIAAETGKDYETVAGALAKANDGNVNALKRLGITLGDQASNFADYLKAQSAVTKAQDALGLAYDNFGPKSKQYIAAVAKVKDAESKRDAIAGNGIDWETELAKSVKGAAKAAAKNDPWATISTIWGQTKEAIGQFAIAPMQEFADWFSDPKNQASIQAWIENIGTKSQEIGDEIRTMLANWKKEWADFSNALMGPGSFYDNLKQMWELIVKITDGAYKLTHGGKSADEVTKENFKKDAPKRQETLKRQAPYLPAGGAYATTRGDVNVTVINGKQESALDSAALALRLSRQRKAMS